MSLNNRIRWQSIGVITRQQITLTSRSRRTRHWERLPFYPQTVVMDIRWWRPVPPRLLGPCKGRHPMAVCSQKWQLTEITLTLYPTKPIHSQWEIWVQSFNQMADPGLIQALQFTSPISISCLLNVVILATQINWNRHWLYMKHKRKSFNKK